MMPASSAIATAMATPMLNGFTTVHLPRGRADDMGSNAGRFTVTGLRSKPWGAHRD
jgi:hypothetical protein